MKRGYVFSLLVALLLGFMMLVATYYLNSVPATEAFQYHKLAPGMMEKSAAIDIVQTLGLTTARGAHLNIAETRPWPNRVAAASQWNQLLAAYKNATFDNITFYTENVSKLDTTLRLIGNGVDYSSTANALALTHTGKYLLLNTTISTTNASVCSLDANGTVATRIIINNFDSGAKYTSPGTSYSCFFTFSAGGNATVTIDAAGKVTADYSYAPTITSQHVSLDAAGPIYLVTDAYNITTTGADPGWNTTGINGTKKYATIAGYHAVLADTDGDTYYDYAFFDTDGDSAFGGAGDVWYQREGYTGLNGKGFYMRFDLAGQWIALYNALGLRAGESWKGVAL